MNTESKNTNNKSTKKSVVKKGSGDKKEIVKKTEANTSGKEEKKFQTSVKKQRKPLSKIAVLALLLTLIVGGVASYEYYLLQIQGKELQTQTNKSFEFSQSQNELKVRFGKLEQDLQNTREALTAENNALKASMDAVLAKLGRTTSAWRLAEVEYLLTVANHRLNLVQDRTTAIAVFETADERLLAIGDPGLLNVRKAIADELNMLRGISEPDITGMALRLSSLANEIEKLPLIYKERVDLATGKTQIPKPESWSEVPAAMWKEIKNLVVIRRHQQPTEPLIPPAEAWFLHQNLRLKLEQAQLALLRRDTALFRENLEEARTWIQTFFDEDSAAVKSAITTLDTQAKVELKLDIPDVSGSLRELRRLLTQRGVTLENKESD